MSLRTDAAAAYAATQTGRAVAARAALAAVLTPAVVSAMTIAATIVEDGFTLLIFTDLDLFFGVRSEAVFDDNGVHISDTGWVVHLVADQDGWTDLAPILTLSDLGEALPLAPVHPITYPAWAIGMVCVIGTMVTYGGFTWRCILAHTAVVGYEPPNKPGFWTKVA